MKLPKTVEQTFRKLTVVAGMLTAGCGYITTPKTTAQIQEEATKFEIERVLSSPTQDTLQTVEVDPEQNIKEAIKNLDEVINEGRATFTDEEKNKIINELLDPDVSGASLFIVSRFFSEDAQKILEQGAGILAKHPRLAPHVVNKIREIMKGKLEINEEPADHESMLSRALRYAENEAKKITAEGVDRLNDPRANDPKLVEKVAQEFLRTKEINRDKE